MSQNLFKQHSISAATYLGGPLAGAILMRSNFIKMGEPKKGEQSIIIGIIASIIIFGGIFLVPENIVEAIPGPFIPLLYTGIVYYLAGKMQGEFLKAHLDNEGQFYSVWRALGIGLVCLLIYVLPVLGYIGLTSYDDLQYEKSMVEFGANETEAMRINNLLDGNQVDSAANFILLIGIPKWQDNMKVIEKMNRIENLPESLLEHNELLKTYCELRIKSYQALGRALNENTDKYNDKLAEIDLEIQEVLKKMQ